MAQVQNAVHVRVGKIAKELFLGGTFGRRINLKDLGIRPLGLYGHGWQRRSQDQRCEFSGGVKSPCTRLLAAPGSPACH